MKKRIASVLVGIFLLSVCTLLALYWPTGIETNIRNEIGKSALHLLVVQPSTGVKWGADGAHELLQQINQIVLGFLASTTPREGETS